MKPYVWFPGQQKLNNSSNKTLLTFHAQISLDFSKKKSDYQLLLFTAKFLSQCMSLILYWFLNNTNVLWLFLFAFVFWLTSLFWSSRLPEADVSRILKLPLQASVEEICISVTCYAYHLLILTSLSLSLNKKSSHRLLLTTLATPVFILRLVFYHIWPSCHSW